MLLQHSLGSLPRFDSAVSALADACSGDKTHGTVITAEGDDEVFAFAAAVDLTRDKVRARELAGSTHRVLPCTWAGFTVAHTHLRA